MATIVVAQDRNGLIGKDGGLPWHCPEDLKHFKELTTGHVVIMGRKTWDALPEKYRPLPGRTNMILSRNDLGLGADTPVFFDLGKAVAFVNGYPNGQEVFIIGGAQVYREALEKNLVDKMIVSEIAGDYSGDTYFPQVEGMWERTHKEVKSDRLTVYHLERRH